eukprot:CAMPEP_0176486626 /NCGR_PEP_ID=MMETSP0200_2-20121128/5671_1 /TAXON_ID=947934 /ORGANISM="Chaetoceros sp., Strain GSL56" /LENGTH=568 /DNA_ID=CAMNT_0017883345 /DNA_START=36 /DNA_END=1742 /DNA_ORIENTATION=-
MSSQMNIDSEQPGYLLAQYMNSISHDIIHNRFNRKAQVVELGNFYNKLKLQSYGQTYLRSSIAILISDLCGDKIECLKTWKDQDWDNFKSDFICCYKILIRKDAPYFFIPGVEISEGSEEQTPPKAFLDFQKKQLRYKSRQVDVNVKAMVSKDFRDAFLRIEVQKALSIIRDHLDSCLSSPSSSSDAMQQSNETKEVFQKYIACIQGTLAFEKHPSVKEALLSIVDQERLCLKKRTDLVCCFKNNHILQTHTLEELYVRFEIMLREWEKLVLPKPNFLPNHYLPSEQEEDDGDSYIFQRVESIDETDSLEEEKDDVEEDKDAETQMEPTNELATQGAVQEEEMTSNRNDKVELPNNNNVAVTTKTRTRNATATVHRSEDDAIFETAMDTQEEKNGVLEPRTLNEQNLVKNLVNKREKLRAGTKDPLASVVKVAATATTKVAAVVSEYSPLKKKRLVMEDSDVDDGPSRTSQSSQRKKKRKSTGSSSKIKRKILDSSEDELWEDTEVKCQGVRYRWTEEETKAVKDGYEIYGKNWATIKKEFAKVLKKRSNVQIKDKFRNMVRAGEIAE